MISSLFSLSSLFSNALKLDLASRCFIELYDGKYLIGKDGSLATVLRVDGLKDMKSFLDLNYFLGRASKMLNSPLGQRGRALQIWYECNPDLATSQARDLVHTPRAMADRLGLDMAGFLDDREAHLARRLTPDALYFVLWTRQGVLTRHEGKQIGKEKPPSWWPGAQLSQDLFKAIPKLRVKHAAWVNEILSSLRTLGLSVTQMNGHESVAGLRRNFRPNFDHSRYKGWLPGDPIPKGETGAVRMPDAEAGIRNDDVSHMLWPQIGPLVVDDVDAEKVSGRIIRLGEVFYAPLEMKVGPQEPQAFGRLYKRLAADKLPWRMSILLEGEGEKAFWMKKALALAAGWSSEDTKMIKESLDAATAISRSGTSIMRTRICFGTWGGSIKSAETRVAQLQQAVESWGTCITSSGGDPLTMSFSSMVGLDPASAATSGLSTINGALRFAPWARQASPLSRGSTIFVTEENTAWNWMPGNSLQDAPVEIVIGPMGKGKSVMMATLAMSFILSPNSNPSGIPKLPRYSLLDIGPSSYGLIESLRNMLPAHRKDEAQYHRMTMEPHFSINFLDLQPGLRSPLKVERMFIINMLCAMVTPTGETKVPPGLAELAGQVVDEAYRQFSDDPSIAGTPKLWSPGEDPEIDDVLGRIGFTPVQGVTTWFQIVDLLHDRGHTNEAITAQRNASPMLADLMGIVKSTTIEDTWRGATLGTGESMIQVFWRAIANTLREYPIFSRPTQFRLGIGRVVSLDLQHVTGSGSDASDRRTGIMFMLGRYMLTRNYYTSKDSAWIAPQNWKQWHEARARDAQESPARFAMDEFHRTAKVPAIQLQVETDVREGRKFNIQIILASQIVTDFPPAIIELASCIWVLGCNTDAGARSIAQIFGLSDAAVESIPLFLLGPGPRGAPFMALLNMKDGRHEHRLYNVIGPGEAWAYSTSPDDVTLRQRISTRMPFAQACRQLGKLFPTGSASAMFKEIRDSDPTALAFDIIEERVLMAA